MLRRSSRHSIRAVNAAPCFDPALLARYGVTGPRYTSYPTAPNFRADFDPGAYRAAAHASNEEPIPRSLSVYVHIPFCTSPCFYCGCTRVITRDRAKGRAYLARLHREIALQSPLFDRDRRVTQLHLGGGTPNFLTADQLGELVDALHGGFNLATGDDREFSVELDPRCAGDGLLAALGHIGFNRVSFGVQDFDPVVQDAINRVQPVEQTLDAIADARAAGFRSVSVDLIYGLPRQTVEGFADTLDTIARIRPDRVALYSYAHLPAMFKAQRQIDESELPAPPEKLGMLRQAIDTLGQAGYRYIGMDHFALPEDELVRAQERGTLQRNFQGYSTHAECDLIGLGMSAIGRVGDCFVQNHRGLAEYDAAVDAGHLPIARGMLLGEDDRLRAELIQQVMCRGEIDEYEFGRRHGLVFSERFAAELERVAPLARDGLVERSGGVLRVTPRGRLLLRVVAMAFDAYLTQPRENVARYSKVI